MLFTFPQAELNSLPLPRHSNKDILQCTLSKSLTYILANLKELCNQGINAQVTIQSIKKEGEFGMKSATPEV